MTPPAKPQQRSATVTDLVASQLPMWPERMRGLPNAFARSALFTVANIRKGDRKNLKRHKIASVANITIEYTGEELRTDDEDLFMQLVHLARHQELGTEVRFTAHALLTELGWTKNKESYKRLVDCIDRLSANSLSVTVDRGVVREAFSGSLIRTFRWREQASDVPLREWVVDLEPEIVALFGPTSYTRVEWGLRMRLSPLEKWLLSFYHSHATPFPYKVETLRTLSGSDTKELRQYRYKLKLALARLVEHQFLLSAKIDPRTDTVIVERNLALAQG